MRLAAILLAMLTWATAARAEPPSLRDYVALPQVAHPAMAPDGHAVAYLSAVGDTQTLFILEKGQRQAVNVATPGLDLRQIAWIDDEHLALFCSTWLDRPPMLPKQRVLQLLSYDYRTSKTATMLEGMPNTIPFVAGGLVQYGHYHGRPTVYMRGLSQGPVFPLFAADADTGQAIRLQDGSFNSENWVSTPSGVPVAASVFDTRRDVSRLYFIDRYESTPRDLPDPKASFDLLGLGRTQSSVAVSQSGDLLEVSPDGKVSQPLQPAGFEVSRAIHDRATGTLVGLTTTDKSLDPIFFDRQLQAAWLKAKIVMARKRITFVDVDEGGRQFIVHTESETDAGTFYWIDTAGAAAIVIGKQHPGLDDHLASVKMMSFKASDGLALTAAVTSPTPAPTGGLPAVVLVHDLTSPPDDQGFDGYAQALASQGYLTIEVNYRGTVGLGPALRSAGDGELGRRMQSDLSDAVAALRLEGLVDPKRVCIAGSYYGGYAALEGITAQGSTYRCAIGIDPLTNLRENITIPSIWQRGGRWRLLRTWRRAIGEDKLGSARLSELSPTEHANAANGPILIVYHDREAHLATADAKQVQRVFQAAGKKISSLALDPQTQDEQTSVGREKTISAIIEFLKANDAPI